MANIERVNWYDGMNITEADMDVEQTSNTSSLATNTEYIVGSGVAKEFSIQRVLFDSDDVPSAIQNLIDTQNFDGEPIYPLDSFGNTVYIQPSDSSTGNQLEVELSGSGLDGYRACKVFIFGTVFGGAFRQEVLNFEVNESQFTRQYFTKIVAIMTQDLFGNQNIVIDGNKCDNNGGRLRIMESIPMSVVRDPIMAEQSIEPNMNYVNFKPATLSKNLDTLLEEIAETESLNSDDLRINTTATTTRTLSPTNSVGAIIGEKFQATTNNIQKVSILLSVERDDLALSGHEYDWSGDIVVGIRKLQTTARCPTDTVPGLLIEYDPEPSALSEISVDQQDLAARGIVLNEQLQTVEFIFTDTALANPNVSPNIEVGSYYVLTIHRSGSVSRGTIVLQEAANTDDDPGVTDNMRMSVFSQNKWVDVPDSDLWFIVYTSAVRVTNGTAFDDGIHIEVPKVQTNTSTGLEESYIDGHHSLLDISQSTENYVIVQKVVNYTTPKPHPATGNQVYTRVEDGPDVAVVSEGTLTTLIDAGNKTIVLGAARDTNPINNPTIEGVLDFPGLVRDNTFTIIQPSSDISLNNLIGSILTPNVNKPDFTYRIIKVENFIDAYGDVNGDGIIDLNDVTRAQQLDGYSKDLIHGTIPYINQQMAIQNGTVTIEEILRAEVDEDGNIDVFDAQAIQRYIALGEAFPAGSSFNRTVITVESLLNPRTAAANMIGADATFNVVPYSPVEFKIEFVPLWEPHNMVISDLRRYVPSTFTDITSDDITGDDQNGGTNTAFLPGDLMLQGEILAPDGTPYSIDFEVGQIVVDLPEGSTQGEVDIFGNFIRDKMKFYDGTYVGNRALDNNQVRVSAAIQSFVKDSDGYDFESNDGYEQVQQTIAVFYNQSAGVLRIRANNIRNLPTRPEMRTKIILSVYLKKAGFKNTETSVSSDRVTELLMPM